MAKKADKEGNKKGFHLGLAIGIGVLALSVAMVFVPDEWIYRIGREKPDTKAEDNLSGYVAIENKIDIHDEKNGMVKYNTVYGGSNYGVAVERYAEETGIDYTEVYDYIAEQDLYSIYADLRHAPVNGKFLMVDSNWSGSADEFSGYTQIAFDKALEVIGLANDYFVLSRVNNSDIIVVLDCRDMYFSKDDKLIQLGMKLSATADMSYVETSNAGAYTYMFVGVADAGMTPVEEEITSHGLTGELSEALKGLSLPKLKGGNVNAEGNVVLSRYDTDSMHQTITNLDKNSVYSINFLKYMGTGHGYDVFEAVSRSESAEGIGVYVLVDEGNLPIEATSMTFAGDNALYFVSDNDIIFLYTEVLR